MKIFIFILIASLAGMVFMALCLHFSNYQRKRHACRDRDPEECAGAPQHDRSCTILKFHNSEKKGKRGNLHMATKG
jgi:hypothetical protein